MSDTPLKPCPVPWCASQHVTTRHYDAKRRQHWVECFKCNFKTPQMPSKTNAIAAWNTRQPTQSDALREAVIDECAKALEADAKKCACGAWDDYKSITSQRAIEIVRALQEQGT